MKHYEVSVPLSFDPDTPAFCIMQTRPATKDEIIAYLEEENDRLNRMLGILKEYCGKDYIDAALELQCFLNEHPAESAVTCREPFVTAASQEALRRGKEHACKPTRRP